jgi:hypothetical protein
MLTQDENICCRSGLSEAGELYCIDGQIGGVRAGRASVAGSHCIMFEVEFRVPHHIICELYQSVIGFGLG